MALTDNWGSIARAVGAGVYSVTKFTWDLMKVFAPSITVLALVLSLLQVWSATKQRKEIEELARSIATISSNTREIAGSLSTQYVDAFPHNMDAIVALVASTKETLEVTVDFPTYGSFSNPEMFRRYEEELRTLAGEGVKILIRTYDAEAAASATADQFEKADFEDFVQGAEFDLYFNKYFPNKRRPTNMKEFYDGLLMDDQRFTEDMRLRGVAFEEVHEQLPLFLWLSDDARAIFSFPVYGEDPHEVSFKTNDRNLIDTLREITYRSSSNTSSNVN